MLLPIEPRHQTVTEIHDPWTDEPAPKLEPDPVIVDPWDHDYDAAIANPWADAPDAAPLDRIIVDPWADDG